MKKRTRKLLSTLLCCVMLLTLLPTMALAEGESETAEPITVDGMTFSYTDDAELVRLSSIYDGCPILIWKGHIRVTYEDETSILLNSAGSELLSKLRPVWKNTETGQEVTVDTTIDVTVPSNGKYYIGPVTAGTYAFTLEYTPEDSEPVTVLPEFTATISTYEFERITERSMFNEAASWGLQCAIVGEADGQFYVMSMYADENDGDELAAIPVSPDGDGHIILGNDPALLFAPYHYLGAMKHYGDSSSDETLLWDFGTGIFGAYHIEGYVQEGSMWVSGGTVERYSGATNADIRIMLTFADGGAVTMYSPYMGHSDKYLRLAKNGDNSYVFTSKAVAEDTRESYPVYLYRRYVEVTPTATETKYEYIGEALDKTYDGEAVTLPLDTILASQAGTTTIEQPLNQTGLYGKYVTGVWYKIEGSESTLITGGEIMDAESPWLIFAMTGPTEPGDYQFVLQSAFPEDWEADPPVYPVYLTLNFTISPAGEHTHTYGDWTCYDENQHQRTCTANDDIQYANHTWNNGQVTTAATCTENGVMTYTCTVCNGTKTEPISAAGHTYGNWEPYDDTQHKQTCTAGDDTQYENHTMSDWAEDLTTVNSLSRFCSVCGYWERKIKEGITVTIPDQANENGNFVVGETGNETTTGIMLPGTTFDTLNTNLANDTNATGATIVVGTASVTYDATAVETISNAVSTAAGEGGVSSVSVTLVVEETTDGNSEHQMNNAQQAAVETATASAADVTVYSITLEVFTTGSIEPDVIDDFNGGTATVTVPYDESVGHNDTVTVVRVETDGTTTEVPSSYDGDNQTVTWTTGTHSFYMITKAVSTPTPYPGTGGGYVPPTSAITAEKTENGTVTVSPTSAAAGTTVTVTVKPDAGYELASLTVTDAGGKNIALTDKGDGKYTFNMPDSKVTVSAAFSRVALSFTDVPADAYYYNAVAWAVENKITEGTGDGTTFSPDANCTRGEIVTFLWRAAGCPEPKSIVNPFTDVAEGSYCSKAVLWAVENGITDGTGDGTTFSPDLTCTRDQTVTFLWRAAGKPAVTADKSFADVSADTYYYDAVDWAVANGVTDGTGNNFFSPENECTRGQSVTFLYRWLVK
ncbi:MAG: S-layer homology domain-containing protein [Clostridiales bacterium]|nr:S-layer homology domain-containing protein [Clostridiales bacterium]